MSNGIDELYDEFADDYERTRVPRFRPFVKKLLQLYDTRPGSRVLDAGCGTGLAASMVAPRVGHAGRVLGVDASQKMLEYARKKAQGFGFDQCEFLLGDMFRLPEPAESFDLILCSFSLWGEPQELFTTFLRLLKPDGALLAQNWGNDEDPIETAYNETLAHYTPVSSADRVARIREINAKYFAEWQNVQTLDQYERALRQAGFSHARALWVSNNVHYKDLDELIDFYDVGGASRAQVGAMDENTRAEFHAAVRAALQPFVSPRGIDQAWRVVQLLARK